MPRKTSGRISPTTSSVEFLAKPYSLDQINSKVKEVLGKGAQTIQ